MVIAMDILNRLRDMAAAEGGCGVDVKYDAELKDIVFCTLKDGGVRSVITTDDDRREVTVYDPKSYEALATIGFDEFYKALGDKMAGYGG